MSPLFSCSPVSSPSSRKRLSRFAFAAGLAMLLLSGSTSLTQWHALAGRNDIPQPTPLDLIEPDPLLPEDYKKRPLTPAEQEALASALDQLNAEARAQLIAKNQTRAFEIWNRELRLRRFLGPLLEVKALGRVGDIAWQEEVGDEVRLITRRLKEIEAEEEENERLNLPLRQALAKAYEQVRQRESALRYYEQLLGLAQQRDDRPKEIELLETIARLHLNWFYFPEAAETYQTLLAIAEANGDRPKQILYLKQRIYALDQAKLHQPAIAAKQKLESFYRLGEGLSTDPTELAVPDPVAGLAEIPSLKLSIGIDYAALGQLEDAFGSFQESYTLAWSLQHYSEASDALRQMVGLYLSNDQIYEAMQTYQVLLLTEHKGCNLYGKMVSYDEMAQLYREYQDYGNAMLALQQGLALAHTLKYRVPYFEAQIQQVTSVLAPASSSLDSSLPEDSPTEAETDLPLDRPNQSDRITDRITDRIAVPADNSPDRNLAPELPIDRDSGAGIGTNAIPIEIPNAATGNGNLAPTVNDRPIIEAPIIEPSVVASTDLPQPAVPQEEIYCRVQPPLQSP